MSQQSPIRRLPNQVARMDNAWASPIDGLRKRHPIDHVATIEDGIPDRDIVVHTIVRGDEKYIIVIGMGAIRAFTDTGEPVPVKGPTAPYIPDFTYIDQRRRQILLETETFQSPTWTQLEDALPPEATPIPGPLGFGSAVRLKHAFVTIGNDGVYRQTVAGGTSDERKHFSLFVRKPPSGATAGLRLVLHEGAPSNSSFEVAYLWNGDALELSGAPSTGVEARAVELENGWWRAEMTYQPDGIDPSPLDRVQIELIAQGILGTEHDLDAFGAQLIDSDDWTFAFFPSYIVDAVLDHIRATTVQDFTFVSNSSVPVLKGTTTSPANDGNDHVFVFVRQGGYNAEYNVTVKASTGTTRNVKVETWDGTAATGTEIAAIETQIIADDFLTKLDDFSEFVVFRLGNLIRIQCTNPSDTIDQFTVDDSFGDTAMVGINESVAAFSDLPLTFVHNERIRVVGDATGGEDDYWVRFERDEGSTALFANGKWHEGQAPEILLDLDADTMPHQLVRKFDDGDGTVTGVPRSIYFEWGPATWDERLVGDDDSNPFPSFVSTDDEDRFVRDVFFHKGRLGLISGLNIILSQVGDVFDFFRSTVRTVVASDPIDLESGDKLETELHAAVPLDERMVVFGTRSIFVLQGEPILSPASAELPVVLRLPSIAGPRPANIGRSVLFASLQAGFSSLRELFPLNERTTFETANLTEQAPRYIPGEIIDIAAHETEDEMVVAMRAEGDLSTLYIYKSYQAGRERLQSAVWRYPLSGEVRGMGWIDDRLFLVTSRGISETLPEGFELIGGSTPVVKTWTLNAEFETGTLVDVQDTTIPDALTLVQGTTEFGYLMVPGVATDLYVIAINSDTGDIFGAYRAQPTPIFAGTPINCTFDSVGNCWLSLGFSNADPGAVTKIGIIVGGTRCNAFGTDDPTGEYLKPPFQYSTAVDRDGDGLIHTSLGPSMLLDWDDATDGGSGGPATVTDAEDELILLFQRTQTGDPETHGIAVDANDDPWVFTFPGLNPGRAYHLDGDTGSITQIFPSTGVLPTGGHAAIVDSTGVLWATGGTNSGTFEVLRWDPTTTTTTGLDAGDKAFGLAEDPQGRIWVVTPTALKLYNHAGTIVATYSPPFATDMYGIAIDDSGNAWVASDFDDKVFRVNPTGTTTATIVFPNGDGPTSVAIDRHGDAWILCQVDPCVRRIDHTDNTIDLTVAVPSGFLSESLSNFAHSVNISTKVPTGTWTVEHDGGAAGIVWRTASWTSSETQGAFLSVFVRADDDETLLGSHPWLEVESEVDFTITGRFVEVRVEFTKAPSVEVCPILYDLTLEGQLVTASEGGQMVLESMRVASGLADDDSAFQVCLDRRITEQHVGVDPTYVLMEGVTEYTLPYDVGDPTLMRVITRATAAGEGGFALTIAEIDTTPGANVVRVQGDTAATPVWIGEAFEMIVEPGRPTVAPQSQSGGRVPALEGFEAVLGGAMFLDGPVHLDLRVVPRYGDAFLHEFRNGPLDSGPILGTINTFGHTREFSVMAPPDDVLVTIESNVHLSTRVQAMEWYVSKRTGSPRTG